MKTRIITVCFLFLQLLFAGCSKEEAIDNVDPDVPEVEIPEEDMEIAIQNLERVEEAMSPLFLASENAEELALHLDEIKVMEGVEDAWVGEDAATLWIQIEKGGKVAYHFPPNEYIPEITANIKEIVDKKIPLSTKNETSVVSNKSFCIINQLSNSLADDFKLLYTPMMKQYEAQGFHFREIDCENFTRNFIKTEMPQYGIIFLITHGLFDKSLHWLVTGEEIKSTSPIKRSSWAIDSIVPVHEKRRINGEIEKTTIKYLAVSELFLEKNITTNFQSNSILFCTACYSLRYNNNLWEILKKKKLGCYLGFDNVNSIGVISGIAFFNNLLNGNNVDEAYNKLNFFDKNNFVTIFDWIESSESIWMAISENLISWAELECHPSDCQITLFDKPEVTDEEAVDLGLSVKWGNKNLGASTYTNLGNSYEDYDYDYLYNNSPELFEWNGAELNLGKTKYDYAYTDLGENWRLPTTEEWMELRNNCKWEADIIDNTPGFRVKGPNGNSIFIPGKFHYEPEGGSYAFEANYFSSRMTSLGVRSIYIVGTKTIFGFNSTAVDEYWIEDTAFIRPVCD